MIIIEGLKDDFLNNMKELLKNDFDSYIKSFEKDYYRGLRVNTLKISKENLKNILSKDFGDVNWCQDGLYYEKDFRPAKTPYYNAGLFYIQEPSAMLPVELLDVKEGDYVLDMCGAPGGKSTQIASKLDSKGLLVSNDYSASRAKIMAKNLELMGVKNCTVLAEQQSKLKTRFENFFDKILVDAPCSGEGMFRKEKSLINSWSNDEIIKYSHIQKDLLDNAKDMLKEDGIIVYSTCTLNISENEKVIDEFLKENENFELMQIKHSKLNISKGFSIDSKNNLQNTARILPYKNKGEGHFVAKLRKKTNTTNIKSGYSYFKHEKIKGIQFFYDFIKDNITENILSEEFELKLHGTSLFGVHKNLFNMSNIRVIRSGFHLGELKKNRFEPSQSLALALKSSQFKNILDLSIDDNRVEKYLKGETIHCDEENGWILICLDGHPLGFGKASKNKIKNKYDIKFINL